ADRLASAATLLDRVRVAEHHLGVACGERRAGRRGTRLHEHRVALRRAWHVEPPSRLETRAIVAEHVKFLRVGELARLNIARERVVLPAVPQSFADLDELGGALVPQLVLVVLVEAEVPRLLLHAAGHDVPARTATA